MPPCCAAAGALFIHLFRALEFCQGSAGSRILGRAGGRTAQVRGGQQRSGVPAAAQRGTEPVGGKGPGAWQRRRSIRAARTRAPTLLLRTRRFCFVRRPPLQRESNKVVTRTGTPLLLPSPAVRVAFFYQSCQIYRAAK